MKTKLFSCNPPEVRVFGEHLPPDDDSTIHCTQPNGLRK